MRMKWWILLVLGVGVALLLGIDRIWGVPFSVPLHVYQVKLTLAALSRDPARIKARLAKMVTYSPPDWRDDNLGIAKDGYIFFYDCHDSHGQDNIPDVNIFYLPDEGRFIINRHHFCCGLGENIYDQPKDKAEVLAIALGGDR
jgi:hypothetical protein